MNVEELGHLANWLREHAATAEQKYEAVRAILEHNAQQPQKQPLEDPLNDLLAFLRTVPVHALSNEQIRLLDSFGVSALLGADGVEFVEGAIKKSDFDPATAMADMQGAVTAIRTSNQRASAIIDAFEGIGIHPDAPLEEERALVRVEFRSDASIRNVVDWKDWSERWHEIARGIAVSIGDAPENVHVVGATRGSLIVELAGTYLFVRVLTGIVKAVTGVAKDLVMLAHSVEDLRTKKLLNDKIEKEMKAEAAAREKNGVEKIIGDTKILLPKPIDGEQEGTLKKSISQLLEFHRKGGEVDFVAPEEVPEGDEAEGVVAQITELRQAIEDLRTEKQELKRLTHDQG